MDTPQTQPDTQSSNQAKEPQLIQHVVQEPQTPLEYANEDNIAPTNEEQKPIEKNKIILIVLIIFFVGLIITFVKRLDPFSSSEVKKSFAVTKEIQDTYMPVWKNMFLKTHNMSEEYFNEHVIPTRNDLLKDKYTGEQFVVEYDYIIDWATIKNKDSILIKPKGADDYLSEDDLTKMMANGDLIYANDPIMKIETIISKGMAEDIYSKCRPEMKPAKKPFKVAPFSAYGTDSNRLIYKAIVVISSNQLGIAEVDLVTGELNCFDADIQYSY